MSGPPGSGKSTVARILSGMFEPSALVAGDEFCAMLDRGYIHAWTPAADRQNEIVIGAAAAAAGRLAAGGVNGHLRRGDRPVVPATPSQKVCATSTF